MKRTLTISVLLFVLAIPSFAYMPNEKVLKSFQATFLSPQEVKWYDHDGFYEVCFVQSDIRASVKYDPDGNFMGSTRYYKEQQLPTNILCKLKKKYADKTIFGVTEVTTNEDITYFIKLEDTSTWFTIKVSGNGQMELYEKYKKA